MKTRKVNRSGLVGGNNQEVAVPNNKIWELIQGRITHDGAALETFVIYFKDSEGYTMRQAADIDIGASCCAYFTESLNNLPFKLSEGCLIRVQWTTPPGITSIGLDILVNEYDE